MKEENILSHAELTTQNEVELNKSFSMILKELSSLEVEISDLKNSVKMMNQTVSEIKNNIQFYNRAERQLLNEIHTKWTQQLNTQFDEIHYLQYNMQKLDQSVKDSIRLEKETLADTQTKMDNQLIEIKTANESLNHSVENLIKHLDKDNLNKDDLRVIESFLRLIAANQMIQETYFES